MDRIVKVDSNTMYKQEGALDDDSMTHRTRSICIGIDLRGTILNQTTKYIMLGIL